MKKAVLIFGLFSCIQLYAQAVIPYFTTEETSVTITLQLLAQVSKIKVVATKEIKGKLVSLNMINSTPREVLEAICRDAEVAYSYDYIGDIYTLMTTEKYQNQISLIEPEQIQYFKVTPANLHRIAENISTFYGERVLLSYDTAISGMTVNTNSVLSKGSDIGDDSTNNTVSSPIVKNRNELNGTSNKSFGIAFTTELILKLESKRRASNYVNDDKTLADFLGKHRKHKPTIYVTTNTEHSIISVRTTDSKALGQIAETIRHLNRPIKQVLLEMKILELTVGDNFESHFDLDYIGGRSVLDLGPTYVSAQDKSLTYSMFNDRLSANIEIMKNNNELEILATPMVIAANNRQAELKLIENDIFITGVRYQDPVLDNDGNIQKSGAIITETTEEEVGLTLRILPRINDDRTVNLEVYQESSDKIPDGGSIGVQTDRDFIDVPIDLKKEKTITSTVMAKDGFTVAIGGLVQTKNKVNYKKVPLLGDLPLLGFLFRDEVSENVKTELILLITPHIMDNHNESEIGSKSVIDKVSNHNYFDSGQQGIDQKIKHLEEYNNPPNNKIQEVIKDPDAELFSTNNKDTETP